MISRDSFRPRRGFPLGEVAADAPAGEVGVGSFAAKECLL